MLNYKWIALFIPLLFVELAFSQDLQHFSYNGNTGNNATVVIQTSVNPSIDNVPLESGDELGAFTPDGLCVGAVVWQNENTSITIWGDDPSTVAVDGIQVGESICYRIWSAHANREYQNIEVNYQVDISGSGTYLVNGLYVLMSINAIPPIQPPHLIAPRDGAEVLSSSLPVLTWGSVSKAESYQLYISSDSTLATAQINKSDIVDTTYSVLSLNVDKTYYWRVRSLTPSDTSEWSVVWSFTVRSTAPDLGVIPPIIIQEDRDTTISLNYFESYVQDPNTPFSALQWGCTAIAGVTIDITDSTLTILPKKNWNGNSSLLISVTDGIDTDSTRWQLTVLPVNDAPSAFRLTAPKYGSKFSVTQNILDQPLILHWDNSTDVDEDSLLYVIDIKPNLFSCSNIGPVNITKVALTLKDILGVIQLSRNCTFAFRWNIGATDGIDTTYASNGPYLCYINFEYIVPTDTTKPVLQAGLLQNGQNQDLLTLYLRSSEPLAVPPSMIMDSETLAVVYENADSMDKFHSSFYIGHDGEYDVAIQAKDLSFNETRIHYRFTLHTAMENKEFSLTLPDHSVRVNFPEGSVQPLSHIFLYPLEINNFNKVEDLYPGIGNMHPDNMPISIFQIKSSTKIGRSFTIYGNGERTRYPRLNFYKLTSSGWEKMITTFNVETARSSSTVNDEGIFALFKETNVTETYSDELTLQWNYPNPFQTETTINFSIPHSEVADLQRVTLNVYDVRGQIVRTLLDKAYLPGSYSVIWNGTNQEGRKVSSGVYFYTLRMGKKYKTHKMIYVK